MTPKPLARDGAADAQGTRADELERRAVKAVGADQKRELTAEALSAWMDAASSDIALVSAQTHGAQKNAARAATRVAALAHGSAREMALGARAALDGDLDGARPHFEAARSTGDFATRRAANRALAILTDAAAATDVDAHARALVSARGDVDPRASAAKVAANIEASIAAHPRQALALAELWLLARVDAGALEPRGAVLDVIKAAGHAQSAARVPAVAQKALLLAHAHRLAGDVPKARAAYLRVLDMSSSSEAQLDAATRSLARLDVHSGAHPGIDDDVGALVAALAGRDMLDPVVVRADPSTFAGLLSHVSAGQRGDARRSMHSALSLSLSLGLAAARAAWSSSSSSPKPRAGAPMRRAAVHPQIAARASARTVEAPRDRADVIRALAAELERATCAGPTSGAADVESARAALIALGWRAHPGTTALTKDGARAAFEQFSIAETPSYQLRLETVAADGDTTVHGRTVHVGRLVFGDDDWRIFERGFDETLARYQRVLHTPQGERFVAKDVEDVRTLVSLGRPVDEIPARREALGELGSLVSRARALLDELVRSGKAPRGAMIFVEGIDAASKTTNGMNLKRVFEDAGFSGDWLSFKAPSDAERALPSWLDRYRAHSPADGAVFLADRTFLGDYAYNPAIVDVREMAGDVRAWQRELEDRGVLVIKLLFDPRVLDGASLDNADDTLERPMLTFGKREARALIARDLLERSTLPVDERAGLEAACLGPGYNDLKSFHEGAAAMTRFRAFADATDDASLVGGSWEHVGTKERHDGRVHALAALIRRLEAWRDRSADAR